MSHSIFHPTQAGKHGEVKPRHQQGNRFLVYLPPGPSLYLPRTIQSSRTKHGRRKGFGLDDGNQQDLSRGDGNGKGRGQNQDDADDEAGRSDRNLIQYGGDAATISYEDIGFDGGKKTANAEEKSIDKKTKDISDTSSKSHNHNHDSRILDILADDVSTYLQSTTLISINYRLSPRPLSSTTDSKTKNNHIAAHQDHRYPMPVHDVCTAFSYIKEHYLTSSRDDDGWIGNELYLMGTHLGASLALMLALTEHSSVTRLCITEPLTDWPALDEWLENNQKDGQDGNAYEATSAANARARARKKQSQQPHRSLPNVDATPTLNHLISLRSALFRKPADMFDSFASPVLFLRAPGRDTPTNNWASYFQKEEDFDTPDPTGQDSFGPYDDDWHGIATPPDTNWSSPSDAVASAIGARISSIGSNELELSGMSSDFPDDICTPSPIDSTSKHGQAQQQKRRKVLRRWPPIRDSDDAEFPYTKIFIPASQSVDGSQSVTAHAEAEFSESAQQKKDVADVVRVTVDGDTDSNARAVSHILRPQSIELTGLLRKVCFYGRERTFAEEKILLGKDEPLSKPDDGGLTGAEGMPLGFREMVRWLGEDP